MSAISLRPMSIGDILDVTFRLYRAHFLTYLMIVMVAYLPYSVVAAFFQTQMMTTMEQLERQGAADRQVRPGEGLVTAVQGGPPPGFDPVEPPDMREFFVGFAGLMVVTLLFFIVVWPLVQGALMANMSAGYLGEELGAWESYGRAAPRLLALLGQGFLGGLVIMVGFMLCLVPGIIFSLWFMLAPAVVILERLGPVRALGRSRELMGGNLGKGFLIGFVIFVFGALVNLGVSAVIGLIPWPHQFLLHFSNFVLQAAVVPIQLAPIILLYYDLRIRKEGFDLQRLAADWSGPSQDLGGVGSV